MATFTGTNGADVLDAVTGTITGFTGGTLAQLQDANGDTISGGQSGDTVVAGDGNDEINGQLGADSLTGGQGDDTLNGGNGDDTLQGGPGTDSIVGGDGNDILRVDRPADIVVELANEGNDTIEIATNYPVNSLQRVEYGIDTLANIENITYLGSNTFIGTGNSGNNIIRGGDGDNTLEGNGGRDTLYGGSSDNDFIIDSIDDVIIQPITGSGSDRVIIEGNLINFYSIFGTSIYEVTAFSINSGIYLFGNSDRNLLRGGSANDTFYGGSGNDLIFGENGDDLFLYITPSDISGFESIEGGAGNDTIQVASGDFDFFHQVITEIETLVFSSEATSASTAKFFGDHFLSANSIKDLIGNGQANTFQVAMWDGTYDFSSLTFSNWTPGIDTVVLVTSAFGGGGTSITGTNENDSIIGLSGNDTLTGLQGADTLDGSAGNDILAGGAGNDVYVIDTVDDSITETGVTISDEVWTTLLSFSLGVTANSINVENLTYTGSGNFAGIGSAANNTIVGGTGDDFLTGGAGDDRLKGGAGFDYANYLDAGTTAGINISLAVTGAQVTNGAGTDTLVGIEGLYGSGFDDTLMGDDADVNALYGWGGTDRLTGNGGFDYIEAGDGNDLIDGGAGDDYLLGGTGMDILTFISATAAVYVDMSGASAFANGTATGFDVLSGIEFVYGSDFGDFLFGSAGADTLQGRSGIDIIYGFGLGDYLDGGDDTDYIVGGSGADTIYTGGGQDYIYFQGQNEGLDTVMDWRSSGFDLICIDEPSFGAGLSAGFYLSDAANANRFVAGTAATAAFGQFLWNSATSTLSWDADGTGVGVAVQLVTLTGITSLTAGDVLIL